MTHKVPGTKKTLKTKAGTQIIDRAWRFLKEDPCEPELRSRAKDPESNAVLRPV